MTTFDYARMYETQFRPHRRLRRSIAQVLWAALLLVRPRLALAILAHRRAARRW